MSSTIRVQGARVHNLKNLSVEIPRDQLVVFTGLSGSGKSSLAFDTIYAEGQRRYVESLSAYARQFLGQMDKPDVDFIEGLSPAISIDQKTASRNPRSTVGTITEIHDYLRLLFARVGVQHCPNCGKVVTRQTPQQIVDQVLARPNDERFLVLATVVEGRKGEYSTLLSELAAQGFSRARVDGVVMELAERESLTLARYEKHTIDVVLDRLSVKSSNRQRLTESVEAALKLTRGLVSFLFVDTRRAGPVLREDGLQRLRAQLQRAGAPGLLLQLALRRVSGLHRAGDALRGRSRVGRARRHPLAQRRRAGPVGRRALQVLHSIDRRHRGLGGVRRQHAVEEAAAQGPQAGALRRREALGAGQVPQPLRQGPHLRHDLRRASSTGWSASATRPTATGRANRPSSTCARSSAAPVTASVSSPRSWPSRCTVTTSPRSTR